ncbi:MAG TPA: ABC transporter substrate-binding protein [Streptosporangiaceae bacterium]|nr:ABC transporter substrate-binding protein [Streptosporangiaceae bacterium]
MIPGRVLHRAIILLAAPSLVVAVAGCHVPGTSSPSALPPGENLTVAVVPGIDTVPLAVAVRNGLFSKQGLGISVRDYATVAAAYNALAAGKADIAVGDYTSFFYAIAKQRAKLKLIMDGYDAATGTMQVLALPSSGINSPQDLAGKVIGTTSAEVAPFSQTFPYSIDTLATQSVLQSDGVNMSGISWTELPENQMISDLKDHRVSAILATEPLIIEAETQLGAQEVLDGCSGVSANLPLSGYFSTASFARQHAAALQAFRTALTTGQSQSGQRSNVQSVLQGEHMASLYTDLANIGQYPTFLNVGQVQRIADLMYDSGMIATPVSVQSLVFK